MLSYVEMLDLQCSKQKNSRLGHAGRNREFFFEKFDYISYCGWRICSKQIGPLRPHILGRLLCFAGTHRASAFLLASSGIDGCFPDVSLTASPPHPFMASRRHHLWRQTAVQRSIPLGGDLRIERCKIVEASQNAPPCTVWAAGVFRDPCSNDSSNYRRAALPPEYTLCAGRLVYFWAHRSSASTGRSAPYLLHKRCLVESLRGIACPY